VVKSHEATFFGSKDPSSNTLHFKAIFDSHLKKVVRWASVSGGKCVNKTWLFSSACLSDRNTVFRKMRFKGVQFHI